MISLHCTVANRPFSGPGAVTEITLCGIKPTTLVLQCTYSSQEHVCICAGHADFTLQDYERQEEERSDFLKNHLLKYVDLCVAIDEESAEVS